MFFVELNEKVAKVIVRKLNEKVAKGIVRIHEY